MRSHSSRPTGRIRMRDPAIGIVTRSLLLAVFLFGTLRNCRAQTSGIVCTAGVGQFSAQSLSGVTVTVGAQKDGGFSTRACQATLLWKKQRISVVRDAWQVDVDGMSVNLGLGSPVVALQIKKSQSDPLMTYEIYSLRSPPQLLRTIMGGDSFRSADTDLDGRIEIWAGDAKAAAGFDGVPLENFDFVPTVAMRFEDRRLIDVSSEFRTLYDKQIAKLRAQLEPGALSDFKSSDGTLDSIPPWQVEQKRKLLSTKIKVLEIVWAYLYSGRENEAWADLAAMWPAGDLKRIRESILKARASGITRELDGVAQPGPAIRKLVRVHVYDLRERVMPADAMASKMPRFSQATSSTSEKDVFGSINSPETISISTSPPPSNELLVPKSGVLIDLVIDAAGKVNSAELVNKEFMGPIGDSLIEASGHWKFIPAIKNGQAVASHIRLTVSPYQ